MYGGLPCLPYIIFSRMMSNRSPTRHLIVSYLRKIKFDSDRPESYSCGNKLFVIHTCLVSVSKHPPASPCMADFSPFKGEFFAIPPCEGDSLRT